MRLDPVALLTFLGMLAVTYGARIGGYWFVRRYPVGPRLKAGLEAVPLAVLTAIIAPMVLATGPAESLAAVATLLLAWRFPVLVAVLGGIHHRRAAEAGRQLGAHPATESYAPARHASHGWRFAAGLRRECPFR